MARADDSPATKAKDVERNRKWRAANREKVRDQQRARYAANPEYFARYHAAYYRANKAELYAKAKARAFAKSPHSHVLYHHGMEPSTLDALYEAQGGVCAICERPGPKRGPGCLHIDHDHATGERRGLICNACNRALWAFEKFGGSWALRALAYLGDPPLRRLKEEAS
jgi:hypothetical protein